MRRAWFLAPLLLAALASGVLAAEDADAPPPYRLEMGLTGDWTARNPRARAEVGPLLDELRLDRESFLGGLRVEDRSTLEYLAATCDRVLVLLPPSPPDDQLLQRSVTEVGNTLGLLATFGMGGRAAALGSRLRGVTEGVAGANPENSAAQGLAAAVRRKTERLYR